MSSQLSQVNQTLSNKITSSQIVYAYILNNFDYNAYMIDDHILTTDENIICFIINELLYPSYPALFRSQIIMTASYLIKRGFKNQFILKMKTEYNFNCVSINDLFKFIKSDGKSKAPFFDKPEIDNTPTTQHNCCICLEDYQENHKNYIACTNCKNLKTCIACYDQLSPVKCPQCRTNEFHHINNNSVSNIVKFKYNKKITQHNVEDNHFTDYDDILLIFLEADKNLTEIKIINMSLKSETDMKKDFYDILQDHLFYFNTEVIYACMAPIYDDIITEEMINIIKQTENNKALFKLLNLNYDYFEDDDKELDDFYNYCIAHDSHEHVLNYEYMSLAYFEMNGITLNLICDNNIDSLCKKDDDNFVIEL
jgi:hypothetical protein